ncbi:hypothetical protein Q8A67_007326 [Cirrhinus molitorella]|uniref:Uncharacterized protein n=1 Tax=Cirrhinus molitorella TaxID=172907 RepID=A0AA88Q836_9TELE|nr:hypothetical protein Q8A67_007326 [Cirrhinus molitorella]
MLLVLGDAPNLAGWDITNQDGTGGKSIYRATEFEEESFEVRHTGHQQLAVLHHPQESRALGLQAHGLRVCQRRHGCGEENQRDGH